MHYLPAKYKVCEDLPFATLSLRSAACIPKNEMIFCTASSKVLILVNAYVSSTSQYTPTTSSQAVLKFNLFNFDIWSLRVTSISSSYNIDSLIRIANRYNCRFIYLNLPCTLLYIRHLNPEGR